MAHECRKAHIKQADLKRPSDVSRAGRRPGTGGTGEARRAEARRVKARTKEGEDARSREGRRQALRFDGGMDVVGELITAST